jgi:predicted metalloprotease with PDZ domain
MRTSFRSFAAPLLLLIFSFVSGQASAQNAPRLDYTIAIANAEQHLFHIRIAVTNASGRSLDISMPAWTPGWYTIRAYSANVIKLQAHDNGKRLPLRAIDKQSYRIETGGLRAFTVEYDYFANELSVNGAELNARRGYFVGTNLFFYVPGNTTNTPSNVKFELPTGWRIATGLKKASEPNTFTARNFDNLVDCPVVLGDFDEEVTSVDGKTIHVVVDQKGALSDENRTKLKDMVQRVIDSQAKMFGGLPYNDYWVLFVGGSNLQVGGALEHENSTNVTYRQIADDPRRWIGTVSHEHFHAWNVKRLKPAGLVPYDYSREQYIQELWFAEGVTSYYADVHLMRSGLSTAEEFVTRQGGQIAGLQRNEARKWISLDDASTNTWQTYTPGGPFTVNYYNKGQILGFMLDLEIRGATGGKKSFDDVLRYLYENNYQRGGKGYTNDDVEKVSSDIAGRSLKEFFARYVHGTDEIDYNRILQNAGWRLEEAKAADGRPTFRITDLPTVTDAQRAVRASLLGTSAR